MNKKDLKAVLLASALGSAAFVAPVLAEENSQDPVDVNDQTTQTVTADESTVNDQTTNTEPAETNTVTDGWSDDGYYYENGQMVVSQFKTIDGKTYYFKWDGSFYKDGAYYISSSQYYFDANGVMQTNFEYNNQYFGADGKAVSMQWIQFGNKWRYYGADTTYCTGQFAYMNGEYYAFDDDGYALSGWQKIGDYWYYLTEKGLSLTNQWVDDDMYYVDADGKMVTNKWIDNSSYVGADGKKTVNTWVQVNGKWKYKLGDGTYATQRLIFDKDKYYALDSDGYMVTDDTAYVSNYNAVGDSVSGTVYAGKDGVLVKGWYTGVNHKYYFGDDYFAYDNGLYTIDGKTYYFQYDYLVESTTFVNDGKVYSSDSNGVVTLIDTSGQSKWIQSGNYWYYVKDGVALTSTLEEIDGSYYYFDSDGKMVSSRTFYYGDNAKLYANNDGVVVMNKNAWGKTDDGKIIYYMEDGTLAFDTVLTIDNKLYSFSYDGYLQYGAVYTGDNYYLTDESGAINKTAGWRQYNCRWYYAKTDGSLYKSELATIEGKQYYFDYNGRMVFNEAEYVNDKLCYFDTNGELVDSVDSFTGTKEFHGLTYLNKDGNKYYTGEYGGRYYSMGIMEQSCIVDEKYYVNFNGKIEKGWIKNENSYYYADPTTGVLVKNTWLQINGTWYYFNYFTMATGYSYTDDGVYQFSDSGAMIGKVKPGTWIRDPYTNSLNYVQSDGSGFEGPKLVLNGTTYYFKGKYLQGSGHGFVGWDGVAENCAWYDFNTQTCYWTNETGTGFDTIEGWKKSTNGEIGYVENGKLVTGFKLIDGKGYYFDVTGYLVKGVTNYRGKAYVIDFNGNSVGYEEGWNTLGDESFYIKNGEALTDTVVDGYYINRNGLTHTGIGNRYDLGDLIFVHGKLAKNQWVEFDNVKYYADENGNIAKNQWIGNRYVNRYGGMVKDAWVKDRYIDENGEYKPNGSTSQETKGKWVQKNGKWMYQLGDGTYVKDEFKTIDNKTYYFDTNGYTITAWKKVGSDWYFFDASGCMVKSNWAESCYFGADGVMYTNRFTPDGYYVGSDGVYYTNRWLKDQGKDYYVNGSGKLVKNAWQGAYYLGKDGAMLTNAFTPDGYYVGADGAYVRNEKVTVEGKDYYLNADGKVAKNQWVGDYYLDENGNVAKNTWAGNYWCGEDGKYVKSSWVDNNKYYVGANGIYVTNQWVGDYYLNGAGLVTKNAWVGSYWCGSDGKYVKSQWVDNNKYYVGPNGIYVTNQWVGDYYLNGIGLVTKNAWVGDYWCGSDGKYVKNTWAGNYWCGADGKYMKSAWVDNGKYYVGSNGIYVTNQWIGDYYLNGSGVKVTNAWVGSYWCGSDGKYVKSAWVDNNRYYVNENGVYVAGAWEKDSKGWKYHAGSVYAKDITLNINGTAYTFDSNGYMK